MEELDIVKVLNKSKSSEVKLSSRFAGAIHLSEEEYNNFQDAITQGRREWQRDI